MSASHIMPFDAIRIKVVQNSNAGLILASFTAFTIVWLRSAGTWKYRNKELEMVCLFACLFQGWDGILGLAPVPPFAWQRCPYFQRSPKSWIPFAPLQWFGNPDNYFRNGILFQKNFWSNVKKNCFTGCLDQSDSFCYKSTQYTSCKNQCAIYGLIYCTLLVLIDFCPV